MSAIRAYVWTNLQFNKLVSDSSQKKKKFPEKKESKENLWIKIQE